MNCQECQNALDDLLTTEPSAAEETALAEHLRICRDCAREHAEAQRALAAITVTDPFPVSPDFKRRIMDAISDAHAPQPAPRAIQRRRIRTWQIALGFAVAAVLLMALLPLLRSDRGQSGPSAFGLLAEACAAEEKRFAGKQIVHLVNEIIVLPTDDAEMAKMRWLPLMSLEATGKPRFNQLTLPAEVGKGYTVQDESWYDPASGRFARVLSRGDTPIFANSYDGKNVYVLESPAEGPPRIVSHPIAKDFQPPKSPAEFLGMAAGLRSGLDAKDESLVSDVKKTILDDGAAARVVKLELPKSDAMVAMESYWLVTIRSADNTLESEQWVAHGKPLLEIRRGKAQPDDDPDQGPSTGWDLAGLAKQLAAAVVKTWPAILPDMLILDVSVEHMVKRADFKAYVFSKVPAWTGEAQIADCLDIASPPHRMFSTLYRAKESRHVVLVQSFTYNQGLGEAVKKGKLGKVIYTSPTGVKVWSGPKDEWLAQILLQSARYSIKDPPGKELSGYILETPAGTFPALAINGKLSEEELHALIDSLVPAE